MAIQCANPPNNSTTLRICLKIKARIIHKILVSQSKIVSIERMTPGKEVCKNQDIES